MMMHGAKGLRKSSHVYECIAARLLNRRLLSSLFYHAKVMFTKTDGSYRDIRDSTQAKKFWAKQIWPYQCEVGAEEDGDGAK